MKELDIKVETPIGTLSVKSIGTADAYPGIQISLAKNDTASAEEIVAYVEYNTDDDELRTECYAENIDSPVSIIRHSDGVDLLT